MSLELVSVLVNRFSFLWTAWVAVFLLLQSLCKANTLLAVVYNQCADSLVKQINLCPKTFNNYSFKLLQ